MKPNSSKFYDKKKGIIQSVFLSNGNVSSYEINSLFSIYVVIPFGTRKKLKIKLYYVNLKEKKKKKLVILFNDQLIWMVQFHYLFVEVLFKIGI